MKKQKKLLVLGGTMSTLDVVKTAKHMGIEVTVADYLEDGIAKKEADHAAIISTTDYPALINYIQEHDIDGVFTGASEFNIKNMIELCEKAGLPVYASKEQWDICSNKKRFKKLCEQYEVPTVPAYSFDSQTQSIDYASIHYPVIVKPVDSYSGHGISICQNALELKAGIEYALENSISKQLIIEKYMRGKNVEAYYIVQNGKVKLMSLSDRITRNDQDGSPVPVAFHHPSKYIQKYITKVNDKVCAMFENFGLKQGVFFMEAFYDEDNFYFYEMGYRLNATMEYKFVEHFEHYNPLEFMIQYAVEGIFGNKSVTDTKASIFQGAACELSPLLKKGTISKIEGLEEIKQDASILYVHQLHFEQDRIDSTGTLDQNFARIHVVAAKSDLLYDKIKWILKTLRVYDEHGEQMILPYRKEEVTR